MSIEPSREFNQENNPNTTGRFINALKKVLGFEVEEPNTFEIWCRGCHEAEIKSVDGMYLKESQDATYDLFYICMQPLENYSTKLNSIDGLSSSLAHELLRLGANIVPNDKHGLEQLDAKAAEIELTGGLQMDHHAYIHPIVRRIKKEEQS